MPITLLNLINDFNNSLEGLAVQRSSIQTNTPSENIIPPVIQQIAREIGVPNERLESPDIIIPITACVCNLLQRGGTSPRMNPESTITVGEITIKKSHITKACEKYRITPRQLARSMAQIIAAYCITHQIPGNQSKGYRLYNIAATPQQLAYASDFQTNNPNCPPEVKEWLIQNFNSRFGSK